jgi:hypothetical protein
MESPQRQKGLRMTIQLVRKPPNRQDEQRTSQDRSRRQPHHEAESLHADAGEVFMGDVGLAEHMPDRAAHALEYRSVAVRFGQRNRD